MLWATPFRAAIALQGERVRWLEAIPCECLDQRDPGYGDHRGCDKCQYGYRYTERSLSGDERALITAVRRELMTPDFGIVRIGDLQCTTMPDELGFGDWDRLVLIEREATAKERVRKGTDLLAQEYPARLVSVQTSTTQYVEGTDYRLDAEQRKVVWIPGGAAPAEDTVYAVHYAYHPVYWYTGFELRVPRPASGQDELMPQTGRLSLKAPVEG